MKKKWIVSVVLCGVTALSAAPRKPAAKKGPAAPAVTAPAAAPAVSAAAAAPAPAKNEGGLKVSALVWGGYNIPSSDTFNGIASTTSLTKGGISGGAEFLIGTGWLRGGVAASYVSISSFTTTGISGTERKTVLPLEGVLNLYFMGFYVGGRGGYLLDIGSSDRAGSSYTKTNGTAFGGQAGYQLSFGNLAIDIGAIVTFAHTEATGGTHVDYTNILPRLGVQFTF